MNVVGFKITLLKSHTGPNFSGVPDAIPQHKVIHSEPSKQCDNCTTFEKSKRPTILFCSEYLEQLYAYFDEENDSINMGWILSSTYGDDAGGFLNTYDKAKWSP